MLARNGLGSASALDHIYLERRPAGLQTYNGLDRKLLPSKTKTLPRLCISRARITCSAEDSSKEEAARKALEQAFQGKKSVARKWEEEIKKRELSGGDGGSIGGSFGGGGGGGGDGDMGAGSGPEEPWNWEEFGDMSMATVTLIFFCCLITYGAKNTLAFIRNVFKFIRRGFRLRKVPDNYEIPADRATTILPKSRRRRRRVRPSLLG